MNPASSDDAEISELPLKQCPWCGYGVTGLPAQHACPECGADIDRRWTIFGGPALPTRRVIALRAYILGVSLVPLFLITFLAKPPQGPSWIRLAPVGLGLLIAIVILIVIPLRPRRFLALGPGGLVIAVDAKRRSYERVAWTELDTAKHFPLSKRFEIRRIGGDPISLSASSFFSVDTTEVDRFVREFNRYPRPAATHGPPSPARASLSR